MSFHQTHGPNNRITDAKGRVVILQTALEHQRCHDPARPNHAEVRRALAELDRHYHTDPLAKARARNLLERGIFSPADIAEGISL